MTITPEQVEAALGSSLNRHFLAQAITKAIDAGLVVECATGGDSHRNMVVRRDVADRLVDFAGESGDADASWSTTIDTLLRIADEHAVVKSQLGEYAPLGLVGFYEYYKDKVGLTSQYLPMPDESDELDAEIDRIRDEKIDTLISSLANLSASTDHNTKLTRESLNDDRTIIASLMECYAAQAKQIKALEQRQDTLQSAVENVTSIEYRHNKESLAWDDVLLDRITTLEKGSAFLLERIKVLEQADTAVYPVKHWDMNGWVI